MQVTWAHSGRGCSAWEGGNVRVEGFEGGAAPGEGGFSRASSSSTAWGLRWRAAPIGQDEGHRGGRPSARGGYTYVGDGRRARAGDGEPWGAKTAAYQPAPESRLFAGAAGERGGKRAGVADGEVAGLPGTELRPAEWCQMTSNSEVTLPGPRRGERPREARLASSGSVGQLPARLDGSRILLI